MWKGSFWCILNRSCSGSGATQWASQSCWVVHLLPQVLCLWLCGEAAVLTFSVRTAGEETGENVKHKHSSLDMVWTSSVKVKQSVATGRCFSCGLIAPDSLSPNTVTLPPLGRQSTHTRCITHTHSFTMCHRANYQESACKRGRVIQVSIPEPPLGSRIRRQKTMRDTEGCQSDVRQHHTSPPRKGRCVGPLLANQGLIWLIKKGVCGGNSSGNRRWRV